MKSIITFIFVTISALGFSQEKINVILIGTYHFNNLGFDVGRVKERNILEQSNQANLNEIIQKINNTYRPDKVFVENPYEERENLNRMYALYKQGKDYYKADTLKNDFQKRMLRENEIFQFGFKLARKAGNHKIYSMDYESQMNIGALKSKLSLNPSLTYSDFETKIKQLSDFMNNCISKRSVQKTSKCLDSEKQYSMNNGFYITYFNKINKAPDFYGSQLVTDWYKRNLIMYSYIQNQVEKGDKNIIIIVGAGHAAMMYDFIKNHSQFNLIEVKNLF